MSIVRADPPAEFPSVDAGPEEIFMVSISKATQLFAGLPAEAQPIVRLCDGTRTMTAICAESTLTDHQTVRVLKKLKMLHIIQHKHAGTGPTCVDPDELRRWLTESACHESFSNDDETFFAASIDHLIEDPYAG